ncbi:MAG: hypothetical protein M1834_007286 [Cirrosporium novae-zelandiae]|nr:MAG: hypothetical protein M1834_007286 [Cirrosporium novae-zelandiae]
MSSCFGFRNRWDDDDDDEPLLPRYDDDTVLQRKLHQKLHSYQMLRALSMGFMPSTEQIIINLRTLTGSDVLNPENTELSDSGRLLIKYSKEWLVEYIELLRHKNEHDQIQDAIWFLSKSRISLDANELANRASKAKENAGSVAAYESLRTVGTLLFTNSDFRLFLGDLTTIGRQVFADTASSLSGAVKQAGKQLEPSEQELDAIRNPEANGGPPPNAEDFEQEAAEVSRVVGNGLAKTGREALESLKDNVSGEQKETLINRLKRALLKLRKRNDYSDSVSTISLLIKRYARAYSQAASATMSAAADNVETSPELDRAMQNLWALITSFGEKKQWELLEERFKKVMGHSAKDPELEDFMNDVGDAAQKLLTDPSFLDSIDQKVEELRRKSKEVGSGSSLRQDIDDFLKQIQTTFNSVLHDQDIAKLISIGGKIANILNPTHTVSNNELLHDSLNVFIPMFVSAIQFIPIPRLEISSPEIDILLEPLILEPGHTINQTSFLPYKLYLETLNAVSVTKHRFRTTTSLITNITLSLRGLTIRADEIGFWMRAHSGLLRLVDTGIASIALDDRGLDITLDMSLNRALPSTILSLRHVDVTIHKFTYNLRRSKFSPFAWLLKPFIKPLIRKTLEKQLALAIEDFFHFADRELLFARERLRATRVADPNDLATFFKAVTARLVPEDDPDVYTRVGIAAPKKGVFRGVYAPGSVVKVWEDEARGAAERVEEWEAGGWRNEIFDTHVRMMG